MTSEATQDTAAPATTIPVGVIVARERLGHVWQEYRWRVVEVMVPPPPAAEWTMLRQSKNATFYVTGAARIEVHRSETEGYLENIAGETPLLYTVLRLAASDAEFPALHLVTASPTEAQAYGHSGEEVVEAVAMPEPILAIVLGFATENHRPVPFVKRVRQPHARGEAHDFGQEPIFELRRRLGRHSNAGDGGEPER